MPPSHITVTAAPGRKVPIAPSEGAAPGGHVLYVDEGHVVRVRYTQSIRRSIGRGDLTLCNALGVAVSTVEEADAPEAPDHGNVTTPEQLADMRAAAAAATVPKTAPAAPAPAIETLALGKDH